MTKITNFVWNPVDDCIISELDGTGAVQAVYANEPQQYGGVISQRRGTTTHYHHHDAVGSTRFLTDSSGNVTDTYLHDAWGNLVASTGTTVNPFKWVGKYGYYTDNSTAQVYVRARMYQPIVARWMSIDPADSHSHRSRYEYAYNCVVSIRDSSGKWPDCTSTFCTSTGPHNFSEGHTLLKSQVELGDTCDSSFLEMTLHENHSVFQNGKFQQCSEYANPELDHVFRDNARFELIHQHDAVNGVLRPNCTISTEWREDTNKCWDLLHKIRCPLICNTGVIPGSEPCEAPRNFALGVWKYLPGSDYPQEPYNLSTFLIAFDISLNLTSACCAPKKCHSLNASFYWSRESWIFPKPGELEVPPIEPKLVPNNNCSEEDFPAISKVWRFGGA